MVRKNKTAGLTGVKDASTRQTRESSFINWSNRWGDSPPWSNFSDWNNFVNHTGGINQQDVNREFRQHRLSWNKGDWEWNNFNDWRNFEKASSDNHKLVILQPTQFCNINCKYCYLPDRSSINTMSEETIKDISRVIFSSETLKNGFTVVWHAGEPLVLAPGYYERAFGIIQEHNENSVRIRHNFQTNATLIDQEWCDLFKRWDVGIGVSLDGPKFIHDESRVDRRGKGTFDKVMRGVGLLKDNGIPFSVIAVVTSKSLDHPEQIIDFFIENSIYNIGFNLDEMDGSNKKSTLSKSDRSRYGSFLEKVIETVSKSEKPIYIREINQMLNRLRDGPGETISSENTPLHIVTFDYRGNISTFSPELMATKDSRFVFGNVRNIKSVEDILANSKFLQVYGQIKRGIEKCSKRCEYFYLCGGGAPSNKLAENSSLDSTETINCSMRIMETADRTFANMKRQDASVKELTLVKRGS